MQSFTQQYLPYITNNKKELKKRVIIVVHIYSSLGSRV